MQQRTLSTPGQSVRRSPSKADKDRLRVRFRLLSLEFKKWKQNSKPDEDSCPRNKLPNSIIDRNTKRSLIHSPNKRRTSNFPSPGKKKSPLKKLQPLERKRKRNDKENILNQAKFFKSKSSCGVSNTESKSGNLLARTKNDRELMHLRTVPDLSAANKKILKWAVYKSLKLHNISVNNPQFKIFASVLAAVTRRCLFVSGVNQEDSAISEKMLRMAKRHSCAVVRGKSIVEIMTVYKKLESQENIAPQDCKPFLNNESSFSKDYALIDRDSNSSRPVVELSRINSVRRHLNFSNNR